MKNSNKISFSILAISLLCFLIINPSSQDSITTKEITQNKKPIKRSKGAVKKISRSIASVKPNKVVKKQRTVIGRYDDINKVQMINEESEHWQQNYQRSFFRMLGKTKVKDFKIEHKDSILKVRRGIGEKLEHIRVSYKKPNGDPFSFEALIDSETGQLKQTWNKTRYEYRKPTSFSAEGKELFKD